LSFSSHCFLFAVAIFSSFFIGTLSILAPLRNVIFSLITSSGSALVSDLTESTGIVFGLDLSAFFVLFLDLRPKVKYPVYNTDLGLFNTCLPRV